MLPLTPIAAFAAVSALPVAAPAPAPADPPIATPDAPAGRAKCDALRPRYAGQGSADLRRLDELPPGRLELTVHRTVDGCPIPAVVRENIAPQADGPPRR